MNIPFRLRPEAETGAPASEPLSEQASRNARLRSRDLLGRAATGEPVGPNEADAAARAIFLRDVVDGLSRSRKTLPPKYFYDLEGSKIFEEITRLPEYYPTRTELAILRASGPAIRDLTPRGAVVVEFGSGSSEKIRVLLRALPDLAAYVPIDVSAEFLEAEAEGLRADLPGLDILPVAADFTADVALPPVLAGRPRVGFFPGSTIGNFEPDTAGWLLGRFAALLGSGSLLILGVDLVKDDERLNAAYDDAAGVTGRFNMNLLARINGELGADFDLGSFSHRAFFDRTRSRIEMHLVSGRDQVVHVGGHAFPFRAGETIHTENSYKYTPAAFEALASEAGWERVSLFTDPDRLFAVFALRAR